MLTLMFRPKAHASLPRQRAHSGPSGALSYALGIVPQNLQLRTEIRGSHPGVQVRT